MFQQTIIRSEISLREKFTNSISLRVKQKHEKSALMQISAVFGPLSMLTVEQGSKKWLFAHLFNHVFRSP